MSRRRLILGALLAVAVTAPADAQRRVHRPAAAAADWTRHAERTLEGGYLLGNPEARVRIVEYASIGCPHCASFAAEAMTPLKQNYIRTGRVAYEYRPLVLFDSDPGIYLRLLCRTPLAALDTLDRLYATQATWRGRVRAHQAELEAMAGEQRVQAALGFAQLDAVLPATRGGRACTPTPADVQQLAGLQDAARRSGINGTPTFLINGVRQEGVGYWNRPDNQAQSLEPKLRAALAAR